MTSIFRTGIRLGAMALTCLLVHAGAEAQQPQAQSALADADRMAALHMAAMQARALGRPDVAEEILTDILDARPNAAQGRLDLGVAQAEQGRCREARRTFEFGRDLTNLPSFDRAADAAMADLCPGLAPWESDFALELIYDTNINGGARKREFTIDGVRYRLNDSAMAEAGIGGRLFAGVAYNARVTPSFYVVPGVDISAQDVSGSDYDHATLGTSLALRYLGDTIDISAGPRLGFSRDRDGERSRSVGAEASADITLSRRAGLRTNLRFTQIDDPEIDANDRTRTQFRISYIRALTWRDASLELTARVSDTNYDNDLQDLRAYGISTTLSGSLTRQIGLSGRLGYTELRGRARNPFFGQTRHDRIASASLDAAFSQLETALGRPYLGITYKVSESNFPTESFSGVSLNVGITRSF